MKINDKIYCTHHPLLTERKEKLIKKFKELELDVEWIENFPPNDDDKIQYHIKNKGEISLFKKHFYCLKDQIEKNYNQILILEDDVILPDNFINFYNQAIDEFNKLEGDVLMFGIAWKKMPENIINNKLVYENKVPTCRGTHCYVVKLNAAKKLVEYITEVYLQMPIDDTLSWGMRHSKLKCFWVHPGIEQGGFGSVLGNHNF